MPGPAPSLVLRGSRRSPAPSGRATTAVTATVRSEMLVRSSGSEPGGTESTSTEAVFLPLPRMFRPPLLFRRLVAFIQNVFPAFLPEETASHRVIAVGIPLPERGNCAGADGAYM